MAPITVDPSALSDAGVSVVQAGDGLASAVSTLTGLIDANTGHDAAGRVFGRQYVSAATELLKAAGSGVNACRNVGYGVQVSAVNYSRAEAASDISGRSAALSAPPCPAPMSVPGSPSSSGASVPPPFLWSVVQQFVGSVWPDGNPAELRAAAAAWRSLAAPLRSAGAQVSGARIAIGGQVIDEGPAIATHIDGIDAGLSNVASSCEQLAATVEGYATKVEKTQDAIRDLCDQLGSIGGVVGMFFEFVRGHGMDEVHEIADDIKTVIAHLGSETDASLQWLESTKNSVDAWFVSMEKSANKEFVDFFGEPAGTALSSQLNPIVDSADGLFRWGTGMLESVAALDPTRFASDPEGAKQTWAGIFEQGKFLANPAAAVLSDPHGSLETVKGLLHGEDWNKDRPMIAGTEIGLDVLSAGFGMTKAGALGKADRALPDSLEPSTSPHGGGAVGGGAPGLGDLAKATAGDAQALENLAQKPISPGGRPVSLSGDAGHGPTGKVSPVEPGAGRAAEPSAHPTSTAGAPESVTAGSEKLPGVGAGEAEHIPAVRGLLADNVKSVENFTATGDHGLAGTETEAVGAPHGLDSSTHGPRPVEPSPGWSAAHETGHSTEQPRAHSGVTGGPTPEVRAAALPVHPAQAPHEHADSRHHSEDASAAQRDSDAHPVGHEGSSWDSPAGEHAANSLPADDSGYRIQPRDCDFLDITPEQVEAWANRQAPLGMSPAQFTEFRATLFDALQQEGFRPEDLDVRLQGSSANFFSGEHKSLPLASDIHGNPEASARMQQWFDGDPDRPLRRPFDSMHRLGLEDEPSDYDIQISSDAMTEACRRQWELDGSDGEFINPKYGFIDKDAFRVMFPSLREWVNHWQAETGRRVVPALFPGGGPPDTSAAGISSHFRESDWQIHPEGSRRP